MASIGGDEGIVGVGGGGGVWSRNVFVGGVLDDMMVVASDYSV